MEARSPVIPSSFISLCGSQAEPSIGVDEALRHTLPRGIQGAQAVLRRRVALLRGPTVPAHGLVAVLRDTSALGGHEKGTFNLLSATLGASLLSAAGWWLR